MAASFGRADKDANVLGSAAAVNAGNPVIAGSAPGCVAVRQLALSLKRQCKL
jgi:hypothetical protein